MVSSGPFKDQTQTHLHGLPRKLLPYALYALLPIALFRLYFHPPALLQTPPDPLPLVNTVIFASSSPSQEKVSTCEIPCDYTNGKWVRDRSGPLYNGTTCGTIKDGQNCFTHGRPDSDFLYWRWKPEACPLPRFVPDAFLRILRNRNLAFVGDSLARNQLESLLCMLATVSMPNLVYRNGDDNKFRRWYFPSHNVTLSIYWSPFLVRGVEKSSSGPDHNKLYLDDVDERWAGEMDRMDMIVLSIGHWFLNPAVFHEGDAVIGCHYCPGLNHTEVGFYQVLGKAFRTTLKAIAERRGGRSPIDVVVTTFSPSHFEGDWDKAGACPKTRPFGEGEKLLEGMDDEMRRVEVEEVEAAAKSYAEQFPGFRVRALDVTKLSLMRPDGHPGPYMNPFPFADGVKKERVQNDCVHWCLPGPIDTWNEILLEVMKRWNGDEHDHHQSLFQSQSQSRR